MYNAQLDTFICIADNGSFNKAAEKLFISSTAVIKQINALENHLDIKLFYRNNHGVTLTPAGSVLYRHAKKIIACSETALSAARAAAGISDKTFYVGTSLLNPCKPFMDIWYQLSDRFPGYKLHIVPFEDDHTEILSKVSLIGEKIDFLVAACDSEEWLKRCRFLQLGTYDLCAAVSRNHPLARKKKLTLRDFSDSKVMLGKEGDSNTIDAVRRLLVGAGIEIEDTQQFYDIEVFNRCEQTQSILITLECWKDVHPSLVTIPVEWGHTVNYGILYALDPPEDVKNFIKYVKNAI